MFGVVMELGFLPSHYTNVIECVYYVHAFFTVTHFIGYWNAVDSGMMEK